MKGSPIPSPNSYDSVQIRTHRAACSLVARPPRDDIAPTHDPGRPMIASVSWSHRLPNHMHRMSGRTEVRHVPKPWGHETIWAATDLYVGKILHINAGQKLSVQYHVQKDETIYLLAGELKYY